MSTGLIAAGAGGLVAFLVGLLGLLLAAARRELRDLQADLKAAESTAELAGEAQARLEDLLADRRERMKDLANENLRLYKYNRELREENASLHQALNALCGEAAWTPTLDGVADTLVFDQPLVAATDESKVDADATAVLAVLDPGVTDTSALVVHRQCERAHQRGDHGRECVLCKDPLHPRVVTS